MKILYVLRCQIGCETFIKVGICSNLSRRLLSLQTGNPRPIEVVKTYRLLNAQRVEKVVHRTLIVERVKGEWFRAERFKPSDGAALTSCWSSANRSALSPSLLDTIQRIVDECGVFAPMPNQYERLSVAI